MKKICRYLLLTFCIIFLYGCGNAEEKELQNMDANTEKSPEQIVLSEEEKSFFTEFIRKHENYGFLLSEYDRPEDVDLDMVLYGGAGFGEQIPEEEIPLYLAKTKQTAIETDCIKLPKQSVEEFVQRKLGIGLNGLAIAFNWTYIEESDSYYHEAGDTNYASFSCSGGFRQNDTYTISFTPEDDWGSLLYECETVLVKTEDGYRFVSNHIKKDSDE